MPDSNNRRCSCCNKPYEDHLMVSCCVCNKHYYHNCINLSTAETRLINSKKSVSWTCTRCSKLGNDINSLKAAIISLEDKLNEIKRNTPHQTKAIPDLEEVIGEINERNKRKNNLIIFGITEENILSRNDRMKSEETKVHEILHFLVPEFPKPDHNRLRRLGKYNVSSSRPRPLRITLNNENEVAKFIKNARKLKESDVYKSFSISYDKTPKQIEYYKQCQIELESRKDKGETNVKISYINGVPKVVNF